jgi:hypothetical protein
VGTNTLTRYRQLKIERDTDDRQMHVDGSRRLAIGLTGETWQSGVKALVQSGIWEDAMGNAGEGWRLDLAMPVDAAATSHLFTLLDCSVPSEPNPPTDYHAFRIPFRERAGLTPNYFISNMHQFVDFKYWIKMVWRRPPAFRCRITNSSDTCGEMV